jgi:hypothetical protein
LVYSETTAVFGLRSSRTDQRRNSLLTDAPPRDQHRAGFEQSDRLNTLTLPDNEVLSTIAASIENAMKTGKTADVRQPCLEFLERAAEFYKVPSCGIRVLAARPLRVRENWTSELFGDYDPGTLNIRLWMRTAVRKEVTSYGTFLSTLCHEFCHHLRGTHADFTSGLRCSITMRRGHL